MKETRLGSPNGIQVNEYLAKTGYDVPESLAKEFIVAGYADSDEAAAPLTVSWPPTDEQLNELSFSALGVLLEGKGIALGPLKSVGARVDAIKSIAALEKTVAGLDEAAWPLTAEQIDALSSLDLAAWLTKKGIKQGDISSESEARAKLYELAGVEKMPPAPWPAGQDVGKIPDAHLAQQLKARGVDISTITSRDAAEEKLREVMGLTAEAPAKVELPTDEQIDSMDETLVAPLLIARGIDVAHIATLDEARAKLKELIAAERAAQE